MADRSKYGKNKNLWRKTYGLKRRKPEVISFLDSNTNVTKSYDLHRTYRHRDYFIIKSSGPLLPIIVLAEYDEGLITFSAASSKTSNFNFVFSSLPDAVVLTVDGVADNSDYIIPFGASFTATSLTVETSAPFTGNIRYRAVYSSTGYPALAISSLEPSSGTFTVSAGSVSETNATNYTASFAALTGIPSLFYKTPWDANANYGADVFLTTETTTASSATGEISAPLTDKIYFIAVQ